jgi:hypothetical protein
VAESIRSGLRRNGPTLWLTGFILLGEVVQARYRTIQFSRRWPKIPDSLRDLKPLGPQLIRRIKRRSDDPNCVPRLIKGSALADLRG